MLKLSGSLLLVLVTFAQAIAVQAESPTINLAQPPSELIVQPMPIQVVEAYPNLRISRPVIVTGAGDDSGRLFIASQTGEIYVIDESDRDVEEPSLFMDINDSVVYKDRENEEGFLGLASIPSSLKRASFTSITR